MRMLTTIILGLTLAVAVAGCRAEPRVPTQAPTQTPAPRTSAPSGGMAAVVTDQTLDAAFAAAKKDGKPVIAIFSAPSWCHWCQKLDQETLTDAKVQGELKSFHVVFVDFDKEKSLASKYKVSGVPYTVLFERSGKKVGDLIGFREPAPFLKEIQQAFSKA